MVALLFQFGYFRVGQLMTPQRLRATFKSDVILGLFPTHSYKCLLNTYRESVSEAGGYFQKQEGSVLPLGCQEKAERNM